MIRNPITLLLALIVTSKLDVASARVTGFYQEKALTLSLPGSRNAHKMESFFYENQCLVFHVTDERGPFTFFVQKLTTFFHLLSINRWIGTAM